MYFPDEAVRIARKFIRDPKGAVTNMVVGLAILLFIALPVFHLFLTGTFRLVDFLISR